MRDNTTRSTVELQKLNLALNQFKSIDLPSNFMLKHCPSSGGYWATIEILVDGEKTSRSAYSMHDCPLAGVFIALLEAKHEITDKKISVCTTAGKIVLLEKMLQNLGIAT